MCLSVFWQWTLGGMMMVFLKGIRFQTRMAEWWWFSTLHCIPDEVKQKTEAALRHFLRFCIQRTSVRDNNDYQGFDRSDNICFCVSIFRPRALCDAPCGRHLIIMGQYSGKLSAGVSKTQSYQRTFFKKLLIARSQEPCCIIWMSMNCWSNDHPGWLFKMKT